MNTVYGMWHGGPNYAVPSVEDTEQFDSIEAVKRALTDRRENRDGRTPVVTDESEFHVWFEDPRGSLDPYPDRLVRFGPRGAVRVERA